MFRIVNRAVAPLAKSGLLVSAPIGPALVVLGTVGRHTGVAREVPVLAVRFGRRVFLGTVRRNAQWLANADADPEVRIWLNGRGHDAEATVHRPPGVDVLQIDMDRGAVDEPTIGCATDN